MFVHACRVYPLNSTNNTLFWWHTIHIQTQHTQIVEVQSSLLNVLLLASESVSHTCLTSVVCRFVHMCECVCERMSVCVRAWPYLPSVWVNMRMCVTVLSRKSTPTRTHLPTHWIHSYTNISPVRLFPSLSRVQVSRKTCGRAQRVRNFLENALRWTIFSLHQLSLLCTFFCFNFSHACFKSSLSTLFSFVTAVENGGQWSRINLFHSGNVAVPGHRIWGALFLLVPPVPHFIQKTCTPYTHSLYHN